jgi:ATP-dependent helicase/DNAse subunit B
MFLNNDDVIDALGGNNINEYIDAYSYNRLKDNVLYSEEQLLKLIAFTKRKIIEIGKRINSGDIKIDPIKNSKVCEYCHYKAICGVEKNTKIGHYLEKYELVDIWKIIGGEVND